MDKLFAAEILWRKWLYLVALKFVGGNDILVRMAKKNDKKGLLISLP